MVTGPMPRKPKATRPNANTAGATIRWRAASRRRTDGAHAVSDAHQREHGEAQPVSAEVAGHKAGQNVQRRAAFARGVTISRTWREVVEVKTFTNSGITAPASVPQLITVASFHHKLVVAAKVGIMK